MHCSFFILLQNIYMDNRLRYQFGKKIRLERNRRNLTQSALAEKADIGEKVVGEIERFEVSTTIDTIEKLAKAFKLQPKDLFDFSDIL